MAQNGNVFDGRIRLKITLTWLDVSYELRKSQSTGVGVIQMQTGIIYDFIWEIFQQISVLVRGEMKIVVHVLSKQIDLEEVKRIVVTYVQ